jgi:hypothetical protein
MKTKQTIVLVVVLLSSHLLYSQKVSTEFPILSGLYLGQKPPGNTPQPFLSTLPDLSRSHSSPVFTPDGNQVYWSTDDTIHFIEQIDGVWTPPRHLKFFRDSINEDIPLLSPDGKRLYFYVSFGDVDRQKRRGIWYVNRTGNDWSVPVSVGSTINDLFGHWQFSVSARGTIYFPGKDEKDEAGCIMVSHRINGKYDKPVKVFESIPGGCPFISPDESYLIFASGFEFDAFWKTQL